MVGELRALVSQIPNGRVATFGDLAEALGDRSAARWVGQCLKDAKFEDSRPVHRVVLQSGLPPGEDAESQRRILGRLIGEGVPVRNGSVDVSAVRFTEFRSSAPLAALQAFQDRVAAAYESQPIDRIPAGIAAIDAAYRADGDGVAALVLWNPADGTGDRSVIVRRPVTFPYITGYLAFREIGLFREAIEEASRRSGEPDLILVDGNGRLHPRRAGIATQLGVVTGTTTIGVGKKLICGSVDLDGISVGEARPIVHEGETIGAAVVSTDRSRPIFVSPGHRIDLEGAVRVVQALFRQHRLPEPLFHADRLSKEAARS